MGKRVVIIIVIILAVAAIASGIYLLQIRGNKPAADAPAAKEKPLLPIGEEKNLPGNPATGEKTVPKPAVQPSTRDLAKQASALVSGRLVRISFRKMLVGADKKNTSTLSFVFYNPADGKTYEANYSPENQKFFKNPNPNPVSDKSETIPESAVNFGYEGMKKLLVANKDYQELRLKYPEAMANCTDTLLKDQQHGWEWRTFCNSMEKNTRLRAIFTTNIESKKVFLMKKEINEGQ